MIKQAMYFGLLAAILMVNTGCCCMPGAIQGFFKGCLCAPFDCFGGGTYYCGDGCGEVYQGDWISSPPCKDPCDRCGNYVGHGGPVAPYHMPRGGSGHAMPMAGEIIMEQGEIPSYENRVSRKPPVIKASHTKASCNCGNH